MQDFARLRDQMVEKQLAARGLSDERVLEALRTVPREEFVPPGLVESAYDDAPLPIAAGQTISQPYVVALMAAALDLTQADRVLEVGTGSGYAAAVLARLAKHVYTVERHAALADAARATLQRLGFDNVTVLECDGTQGWPEQAPFDAIVVSAGSPEDIPQPLLDQLAIGGRLVIPAGSEYLQKLWRVVRTDKDDYQRDDMGSVRFVPLIGKNGWQNDEIQPAPVRAGRRRLRHGIERTCEPFDDVESADLSGLMRRIGDARLVLLGEATHGTAEFYDMRARITRHLITHKGFNAVAVEADWPDAAAIDAYVRGSRQARGSTGTESVPFTRFPTWMWANESVRRFVHWLREHNAGTVSRERATGFYGLDLYSMYGSIAAVLDYLEDVDPATARTARERYGCLMPWAEDPAAYGRAAMSDRYRACEDQVVAMLQELEHRRFEEADWDGERLFDAKQNARLVSNAERYYRAMYYGGRSSWNLRDQHMFDTLEAVLEFRGRDTKAVVWAHNSHLGDARATEMGAQGEHNVGQLARQHHGDQAYLIGFGTDHGTVAAATHWGGPMEIKRVVPAMPGSYERLCHDTRVPRFMLPLRAEPSDERRGAREVREVREGLMEPRLERAIGVIYRPDTERQSHYFQATLPRQFDEFIWFDETSAVQALDVAQKRGPADTFPFGV
jgi:protein-L-isoaspartate(D-aspartate) O-methyltransferase